MTRGAAHSGVENDAGHRSRALDVPSNVDRGDAPVVVVGAGLTGLTAAWALARAGARVVVLEAGVRAGGCVSTVRDDGYVADTGPTTLVGTPDVTRLVGELGLTAECVEALPTARRRYVVRDGRLVPIPGSPAAFASSPLLSMAAKLRLLGEPFVPRRAAGADESVAEFVRRRFGPDVLAYAVEPFIAGTCAGDPERLSARHVLRILTEFEQQHGSVAAGAWRALRRRGESPARPARTILSFRTGLERLTETVAGALGDALQLGTRVRGVHRAEGGWRVVAETDGVRTEVAASAVLFATPAHALMSIELPMPLRHALDPLVSIPHVPMATLALGFRRRDIAHPLDGFGVLVPAVERATILGALFTSSVFEDRTPADHVLVTCFVGGALQPALADVPTTPLVGAVVRDLRALVGVSGAPTFVRHTRWPRAVPQYVLGHDAVTHAAAAAEQANPGLFFAGQYRDGAGLADCVACGYRTAERAAMHARADVRATTARLG